MNRQIKTIIAFLVAFVFVVSVTAGAASAAYQKHDRPTKDPGYDRYPGHPPKHPPKDPGYDRYPGHPPKHPPKHCYGKPPRCHYGKRAVCVHGHWKCPPKPRPKPYPHH